MRHFGTEPGTPKPAVFALDAAMSVRKSALFDLDANRVSDLSGDYPTSAIRAVLLLQGERVRPTDLDPTINAGRLS